jgi:hypothetical protein
MTTVLEVYTTEEQHSVMLFLCAKGLNAKDIHNSGKCLLHKVVHNSVKKFSQGRLKATDAARLGAKVAETTVRRLLCCGFQHTGKAMRQVY